MASKYKATGCARFFFVLIILAPLAYLGASYFNGEDGIQNIKDLIGIDDDSPQRDYIPDDPEPATEKATKSAEQAESQVDDSSGNQSDDKSNDQSEAIEELTGENANLKKDKSDLEATNSNLTKEHAEFEQRIKALEDELNALKMAADTTQ